MAVSKGEQVYVLLISHPKLPNDRYFIEKDDGTSEHDYSALPSADTVRTNFVCVNDLYVYVKKKSSLKEIIVNSVYSCVS